MKSRMEGQDGKLKMTKGKSTWVDGEIASCIVGGTNWLARGNGARIQSAGCIGKGELSTPMARGQTKEPGFLPIREKGD